MPKGVLGDHSLVPSHPVASSTSVLDSLYSICMEMLALRCESKELFCCEKVKIGNSKH